MATITLTLTDTADGSVAIASDYQPHVGQACSAAQGYALEIIARTRRHWGVGTKAATKPATSGPEVFCRAVLDPEDLGFTVNKEVRDRAREALGLPRVEAA